jgi:hypothetical protein
VTQLKRIIVSIIVLVISNGWYIYSCLKYNKESKIIPVEGLVVAILILFYPQFADLFYRIKLLVFRNRAVLLDLIERPYENISQDKIKEIKRTIPDKTSDSSQNEDARGFCNEGRGYWDKGSLYRALSRFHMAFNLDSQYWEALLNISAIYVQLKKLSDAFIVASIVRVKFVKDKYPENIAFARAGLIIAKIIELQMKAGLSNEQMIADEYNRILIILKDSLSKCPSHIRTQTNIIATMIEAKKPLDEINNALEKWGNNENFDKDLYIVLKSENIKEEFKILFPIYWEHGILKQVDILAEK